MNSPVIAAIIEAYRGRGTVHCWSVAACPWIQLEGSWTAPKERFNARRRSDLRRARRHAEKCGAVTVKIYTPPIPNLDALLKEAFAVEAASWKGTDGSVLAHDATAGLVEA